MIQRKCWQTAYSTFVVGQFDRRTGGTGRISWGESRASSEYSDTQNHNAYNSPKTSQGLHRGTVGLLMESLGEKPADAGNFESWDITMSVVKVSRKVSSVHLLHSAVNKLHCAQ